MAVFLVGAIEHGVHGSPLPAWLVIADYVLLTAGMAISVSAERVNLFAEPGVRIQTERGHKVVDVGPFGMNR